VAVLTPILHAESLGTSHEVLNDLGDTSRPSTDLEEEDPLSCF
jgi:hypothetical protein